MTAQEQYVRDCLHAVACLIDQGVTDEFLVIAWNAYMVGADFVPQDNLVMPHEPIGA